MMLYSSNTVFFKTSEVSSLYREICEYPHSIPETAYLLIPTEELGDVPIRIGHPGDLALVVVLITGGPAGRSLDDEDPEALVDGDRGPAAQPEVGFHERVNLRAPKRGYEPEARASESPRTEQPASEPPSPGYEPEARASESPRTEQPASEPPSPGYEPEARASESLKNERPARESPSSEPPARESPKTESPASESPSLEPVLRESSSWRACKRGAPPDPDHRTRPSGAHLKGHDLVNGSSALSHF